MNKYIILTLFSFLVLIAGCMNPSVFVPEQCTLQSDLFCEKWNNNDGIVTIKLINFNTQNLNDFKINIATEDGLMKCKEDKLDVFSGETRKTVTIDCTEIVKKDEIFKGKLLVSYISQQNNEVNVEGRIYFK